MICERNENCELPKKKNENCAERKPDGRGLNKNEPHVICMYKY